MVSGYSFLANMGHVLDTVGNIATAIGKSPIGKFGHYVADAAALATGNPELIPAIEGGNTFASNYGQTHNFGSALKSGALSGGGAYLGGQIGGSLGGNLGTFGDVLGSTANNSIGPLYNSSIGATLGGNAGGFAGNALGQIGGASVGSALGGAVGQKAALGLAGPQKKPIQPMTPPPFKATQMPAANVPGSIAAMSSLTPNQQSTGLANQGTYGGGLGPQENQYFLNLENRKLVNPNGSTNSLDTLQPIENSYLAKLGLGGYGDTTSLLQAISQWKPT